MKITFNLSVLATNASESTLNTTQQKTAAACCTLAYSPISDVTAGIFNRAQMQKKKKKKL